MAAPHPEAPRADGCGHLLGSVPPTEPPQETDAGCSEPPNASLTSEPNAKGGQDWLARHRSQARPGDITVGQYPLGRGRPRGAYRPSRFLQVCSASSTPRSSQSPSGAARMIVSRSSIVGARRRSRARSDLLRDYRLSTSRHVEPWEYRRALRGRRGASLRSPAGWRRRGQQVFCSAWTRPIHSGSLVSTKTCSNGRRVTVGRCTSTEAWTTSWAADWSGARCFGVHGTVGLHGFVFARTMQLRPRESGV